MKFSGSVRIGETVWSPETIQISKTRRKLQMKLELNKVRIQLEQQYFAATIEQDRKIVLKSCRTKDSPSQQKNHCIVIVPGLGQNVLDVFHYIEEQLNLTDGYRHEWFYYSQLEEIPTTRHITMQQVLQSESDLSVIIYKCRDQKNIGIVHVQPNPADPCQTVKFFIQKKKGLTKKTTLQELAAKATQMWILRQQQRVEICQQGLAGVLRRAASSFKSEASFVTAVLKEVGVLNRAFKEDWFSLQDYSNGAILQIGQPIPVNIKAVKK